MTSKIISDGVWSIYVQTKAGTRLLDGEATDSEVARRLFEQAIRNSPPSARVELVNPSGQVVSEGTSR